MYVYQRSSARGHPSAACHSNPQYVELLLYFLLFPVLGYGTLYSSAIHISDVELKLGQ